MWAHLGLTETGIPDALNRLVTLAEMLLSVIFAT